MDGGMESLRFVVVEDGESGDMIGNIISLDVVPGVAINGCGP